MSKTYGSYASSNSPESPMVHLSLIGGVLVLVLHLFNCFYPLFPAWQDLVNDGVGEELFLRLHRTGLFDYFYQPLLLALALALVYALGVKSIKSERISLGGTVSRMVLGTGIYFGSMVIYPFSATLLFAGIYTLLLLGGYLLLLSGLLHIKRIIHDNLLEDQFNKKNRQFVQQRRKITNPHSVNIRTRDGWLNVVNPFRGTMVLGIPGSGKSYAIVEEFIRQHIEKGFTMLVYDYKYPALSEVAYNCFLKNHKRYQKQYGITPKIYVVNFDNPAQSHRINPIAPELMQNQSDALAAAEALFLNINRSYIEKKDFFNLSAVNLVAAIIWFLREYRDGWHCTLPHVISMLSLPDEVLFTVLATRRDLKSLLSPFADALHKKSYEQLSGQTASARIPLSRLATRELFWVLGGSNQQEAHLTLNDPANPALLFLANSANSRNSYSAIFGLLASTLARVVNRPNRLPLSLIIDELPTIYIHGLDHLVATGRSNKISTLLSFQDLSQLERDYGRVAANAIFNTVGNKISGAVVADTARKLSEMIGKVVQRRSSRSHSRYGTTTGTSTTLDALLPPEVIAQLSQGEFCGVLADSHEQRSEQKIFHSRVVANKRGISRQPIPPLRPTESVKPAGEGRGFYDNFIKKMERNQLRIEREVEGIVNEVVFAKKG